MNDLEFRRKAWNKQQTEFRRILLSFAEHDKAINLFFRQHEILHSAKMSQTTPWSYEDEIMDDMLEAQMRRIPGHSEHSVAWIIWHMARIEDVTMNLLVAGSPQILHQDNWRERMNVTTHDTGNALDEDAVAELSTAVDIEALRAYRLAVGSRTRDIVKALSANDLKRKVDPSRLDQIMVENAVAEESRGLIDYWGKRDIAGLLLMPSTRHNMVHLNEAWRLKQKLR
jgi:hypothetical protein